MLNGHIQLKELFVICKLKVTHLAYMFVAGL